MNGFELRIILGFALEVHLPEHVQSRFLAGITAQPRSSLRLQGATDLPALWPAVEAEGLTIVTGSNDLGLSVPDQAHEREQLGTNADDRPWRLVRAAGINNRDAAVVGGKSKSISARGECHGMDPASRVVQVLPAHGVERKPLSPDSRLGPSVDALDEAGEDSGVGVCRAGGKEHRVRMPGHRSDCALDRLLQVLGDPPVIILLEVADGDDPVAGTDGKLGLRRGPADKCRGAVDSQEDEGWLVPLGRGLPDQCVPVYSQRLVHFA